MKKILSCLCIAFAGLSWSTTQAIQVPDNLKLSDKQILNFYLLGNPISFSPSESNDILSGTVVNQLFEGLTRQVASGKTVPAGALSWSYSQKNKTWTFKLRKDAVWSDGQPVTAHDYVYAWKSLIANKNSLYSFYFKSILIKNAKEIIDNKKPASALGITAVDDYTLTIQTEKYLSYFPDTLSISLLLPVPKHVVEKNSNWANWLKNKNLVSNGAFVLKEYSLNGKIVLEKNKTYWDKNNVILTQVNLEILNHNAEALYRYDSGIADVAELNLLSYKHITNKNNDKGNVVAYQSNVANWWALNQKTAPFHNKDVRKAITYALDNKLIAYDATYKGIYTTTVVPNIIKDAIFIEEAKYATLPMQQRIQEAKALLQAQGYSEEYPLVFTLTYDKNENNKRIAIATQSILKKNLGKLVNVKLASYDWDVFYSMRANSDFQASIVQWTPDYNHISTYLDIFLSTNKINYTGFNNKDYDYLAQQSIVTENNIERLKIYQKQNLLLQNDYAVIPLYFNSDIFLVNKNLHGWVNNDLTRRYYKDLYFATPK